MRIPTILPVVLPSGFQNFPEFHLFLAKQPSNCPAPLWIFLRFKKLAIVFNVEQGDSFIQGVLFSLIQNAKLRGIPVRSSVALNRYHSLNSHAPSRRGRPTRFLIFSASLHSLGTAVVKSLIFVKFFQTYFCRRVLTPKLTGLPQAAGAGSIPGHPGWLECYASRSSCQQKKWNLFSASPASEEIHGEEAVQDNCVTMPLPYPGAETQSGWS